MVKPEDVLLAYTWLPFLRMNINMISKMDDVALLTWISQLGILMHIPQSQCGCAIWGLY